MKETLLYRGLHFVNEHTVKVLKRKKNSYQSARFLKDNIRRMHDEKNEQDKINIVFMLQYPEMWNSFATVYEAMKEDDAFNVSVLTFPKGKSISDENGIKVNDAYMFCQKNNIEAIDGVKDGKLFDLNSIPVDYFIVERPYDNDKPDEYSNAKLLKKALVVYISYSCHMTKGVHFRIEFNKIQKYFRLFFADAKDSYQYIEAKTKGEPFAKYQKIYNIGFPRYDLIKKKNKDKTQITTFLWTPRWSVKKSNDITHFWDYVFFLLDFFEQRRELNLVIRPHPLMFRNFVESGYNTQEEIDQIKEKINSIPNISLDSNIDYLVTFETCDALIADVTSLLYEFFFTEKPTILCDEINELSNTGALIKSTFYTVKNEDELKTVLNNLISGEDPQKGRRENILSKLLLENSHAGKAIASEILKDYYEIVR